MILIDKKYSNQEVFNTGIDFGLTCFGTISFEYPYQGIKVINFSNNHPYKNYNFSYTPKNLNEYIHILNNLDKFNYKFNKKEIFEYFYLKRVFLDVDYMKLKLNPSKDLNGYTLNDRFFSTKYYLEWVEKWSLSKHKKIINNITNFLSSKEFYINKNHLE